MTASRHLIVLLIAIILYGVAWAAVAEDSVDQWGGWDTLPDDLLEFDAEDQSMPLSNRLDQLARDGQMDELEALLPDHVLDRWMTQWVPGAGPSAHSLDDLLDRVGPPAGLPGSAGDRPGSGPGDSRPGGPANTPPTGSDNPGGPQNQNRP